MSKSTSEIAAPHISGGEFKNRIARFAQALAPNSVAIIVSNPERTRSNDTEYQYRQSSDILYLNGFNEPGSALVVTNFGGKRAKLTMFVQAKDASLEQWTGIRHGVDGARSSFFASEAHSIDQFETVIGKLLEKADNVYYAFGRNEELDEHFKNVWSKTTVTLQNPEPILHGMRMVKSAQEVAMIAHAGAISADAHCAAMRTCRAGLREYQLQAVLEFVFTSSGAAAPAYGSIVANGGNAWVLHYVSNRDELKDGDLVLIDAAAEWEGYASDITRTFPVNGKFTDAQREIYQLVLDAHYAARKAAKPGSSLRQMHNAASAVLRRGLVRLGILPAEMASARNEARLVKEAKAAGSEKDLVTLATFFPHGLGHDIGIDVHDVTATTRAKSKRRKFVPGICVTDEPGLYFAKDDQRVPERYRGIGVRIEDDLVITEDACMSVTDGVPKEIDEIEALMAG